MQPSGVIHDILIKNRIKYEPIYLLLENENKNTAQFIKVMDNN